MSLTFEYRGSGLTRCSSMLASLPPIAERRSANAISVPERSQVTPDCAMSSCGNLQRSFILQWLPSVWCYC